MLRIPLLSAFIICFSITQAQTNDLIGDLNQDGFIDVLDIVVLVNIITGQIDASEYQLWAGDLNSDAGSDILDVVQLVNVIIVPLDCGD